MTRSEFFEALEEISETIEEARKMDWTDAEESDLIRMQRSIDIFVSDASQEYEDEDGDEDDD